MRNYIFCLSILFSSQSLADVLRFGGSYSLSPTYKVGSFDSQFSSTAYGVDVDFLFKNSSTTVSADPGWFSGASGYWGLGFGYTHWKSDLDSRGASDFVSPNQFGLDLYSFRALFGLSMSFLSLEVPVAILMSREGGSFSSGDEKYGFSYGANLVYHITPEFHFGVGYEQAQFDTGKNQSTGQSGSLANPVSMNQFKILITYSFSLGSSYSGDSGGSNAY